MDKEEILAKSRAENQNKDYYELEVYQKASSFGNVGTVILGSVLLVARAIITEEWDYGLYLMILCPVMFTFWYKWVKLKRQHELIMAVLYTLSTLGFAAAYVVSFLW